MGFILLSRIDEEFKDIVGSKAYNLGIMLKKGIPVVDGFSLYEPHSTDELEYIWDYMKCYRPLVVRSSMGSEDNTSASSAGKYKTILGINSIGELKKAVEVVLCSCRDDFKRAVIIQPLVRSDISGILFTKDPCGGDTLYIEAAWGLGETIVSGVTMPDTYKIEADGNIREQRISYQKSFGLFAKFEEFYGVGKQIEYPFGTVRCVVEYKNKFIGSLEYKNYTRPALNEEEIKELAELAHGIECVFNGVPQDIEFAISEGRIIILQARPVTSIRNTPKSNIDIINKMYLNGAIASPGLAKAKAALYVNDILYKPNVDKYIVVAYQTSPRIIYNYNIDEIAGIITATGGVLCHASIASREMGIPCIVGVGNIMDHVNVGDELCLDADNGRVYLLNSY